MQKLQDGQVNQSTQLCYCREALGKTSFWLRSWSISPQIFASNCNGGLLENPFFCCRCQVSNSFLKRNCRCCTGVLKMNFTHKLEVALLQVGLQVVWKFWDFVLLCLQAPTFINSRWHWGQILLSDAERSDDYIPESSNTLSEREPEKLKRERCFNGRNLTAVNS
jgi:hypothetical protein